MKKAVAISVLAMAVLAGLPGALPARAQETDPGAQPAPVPEFYAAEPALRDFVDRALAASPGLKESAARYRAALEKVPQVTALPDPMATFGQMLRSVETRVGPQLNTVTLSQAFPWFGTLGLRSQLAVKEAAAAFETWRAHQRDVVAQVKSTFYNLGYVDAAIGVTREEQSILEHYERLAQDRYASGVGIQQAVIKAQAELTRILNRLYMLRQQRQTLAARLNTLLDESPMSGVHLTLTTKDETLHVHVGTPEYLARQELSFSKGDRVTVIGSRITGEGFEAILARTVTKGTVVIMLRDKDGQPRWTMDR